MADDIHEVSPASLEVDGEQVEIAPGAVESVTTVVPHPADADSAPGPYVVDGEPMPVNRPPVSTNRPNEPIAQSLIAGAGAPSPEPDYRPEDPPNPKDNPSAYVSAADKDRIQKVADPAAKAPAAKAPAAKAPAAKAPAAKAEADTK